jgi:hypothetical protein
MNLLKVRMNSISRLIAIVLDAAALASYFGKINER